ncbi:MAG: hypothetical protein V3U07_01425, partial [Nitrospirales bacterium]
QGMLETSASGVLGLLSCSRTHLYAPRAKIRVALPEERHVLACTAWAGETAAILNILFCYWSSLEYGNAKQQ